MSAPATAHAAALSGGGEASTAAGGPQVVVLRCTSGCGHCWRPDPAASTGGSLGAGCPRCGGWRFVGGVVDPVPDAPAWTPARHQLLASAAVGRVGYDRGARRPFLRGPRGRARSRIECRTLAELRPTLVAVVAGRGGPRVVLAPAGVTALRGWDLEHGAAL